MNFCCFKQIFAACDLGNALICIIHDHRQVIRRANVAAGQHHIADEILHLFRVKTVETARHAGFVKSHCPQQRHCFARIQTHRTIAGFAPTRPRVDRSIRANRSAFLRG